MFVVHFFENKNSLLIQLLKRVPSPGDELKIKGRKAKVSIIDHIDDKNVHVHVILEEVKKNIPLKLDNSKKKKGK